MPERILIVDDEERIRASLRGILADEGFEVIETGEGTAVLKLVAEQRPRLVILDIWMPELDGIEVLEHLKACEPDLPVIVISGHGTIEAAVRATKLGATDFIEKPFALETILRSVFRALGREAVHRPSHTRASEGSLVSTQVAGQSGCVQARSIKHSVVLRGQGLHSGVRTGVILQPLPPGSGIVFCALSSDVTIPATIEYVDSTDYATSLYRDGVVVKTVEHLMSAFHGYGVTNLMVKMQGEIPILDGSAEEFCQLLDSAGIVEQEETVEELVVDRTYSLTDDSGDKSIRIEPADRFEVHYTLSYPEPVGRQDYHYVHQGAEAYRSEIARARTFGFLRDVQMLEQMGLANGGRLHNCILIGDHGVINPPLRYADELVRHKVLDLIGDLYLLGRPLRGKVTAFRTGHSDNIGLLREIKSDMDRRAGVVSPLASAATAARSAWAT